MLKLEIAGPVLHGSGVFLDPSAVQCDDLAGEIFRCVQDPADEIGDFLDGAGSSGRNLLKESFPVIGRQKSIHLGVDESAGDGIDPNVARRQFLGECPGHGIDAALGGRVGHFRGRSGISPY